MKSIIVISLVALAYAKCDWPSTATTRTITTTVYGSNLPSTSIEGGSQSADMPYTSSTKTGDSGNKSEGYPTLEPTSDMSTSASSKQSDLSSDEEATRCSDPKRHGQADASNMSGTTHSTGAPKKTPTTSQDTETRSPISTGETALSYTTVSNTVTGASDLQGVSATGTVTTATGTEISETAPSSKLPQTGASGDTEKKVPSAAPSHQDHTKLPDDHSTETRPDADRTEKVKTSTTKEATTTVTNLSQTEGFTGSTAIPKTSVITSPGDYSTKQVDTGTETASEETTTTFITSFSKSTTQTTTAVYSTSSDGIRPAFCLYDKISYGPGELDEFRVLNMIPNFCDKPDINKSMKYGDKCKEYSGKDKTKTNYKFQICPRGYCPNYGQHMKYPEGHGGPSCANIFHEIIWKSCVKRNHQGNGGWWKSGCLEYSLEIG